ncbi:hypothetical protein CTAYLR_008867, partial [Chrysophaeum taylorii]
MDFSCEGIPAYDAAQDPHCPIAKTQKFRRQRLKRLRQEHFSPAAGWPHQSNRRKLDPLPRAGNGNPLPITLVTALGGVTWGTGSLPEQGDSGGVPDPPIQAWQPLKSFNPEQELETIKAILLREGYVKRLETALNEWLSAGGVVPDAVGDLFDVLRASTMDVVEMITKWRLAIGRPAPFLWNGMNYLLKIPSDLDDLDHLGALRRWVGFSLKRNPFVLPLPLDFRRTKLSAEMMIAGGDDDVQNAQEQRRPDDEPQHEQQHQRKDRRAPYDTPVVNEPSLIPRRGDKPSSDAATLVPRIASAVPKRNKKKKGTNKRMPTPILSDGTKRRIEAAEKVLLEEEDIHGRYARNQEGRLVPEELAKNERFAAQLKVDKHRDLSEPARADAVVAPHAKFSGVGRVDIDDREEAVKRRLAGEATDYDTLEKRCALAPAPASEQPAFDATTSGASRAARRGAMLLGEQTSATTAGRRRAPTKRSRGVALDSEIGRLQREATRLSREIEEIRGDIGADMAEVELLEADAARLEADAEKRDAKTAEDVQRAKRGKQARQEARERATRLRGECARREMRIVELEAARDARLREAKQRASERRDLKRSERMLEDKRRALELERERRMLDENAVHPADEATARTLEGNCVRAIQRMARGKCARLYTARLRRAYARAALIITAGSRGHFARKRARWHRLIKRGATVIQCHARSSFARVVVAAIKKEKLENEAAVLVGTLFQGMRARRRVKRRRELRVAAFDAAEAVGIRGLFPADLYELAEAIHAAQIDHRVAYPPAAVLGLVRIVVLLLSNERNEAVGDGDEDLEEVVTEYSAIGVRHRLAVERVDLSWSGAMKVLRRAHRLLRRLRALVAGPASIPPRLLSLPRVAIELFEAYALDPTMTVDAMRRLHKGSKACVQLLAFVIALLRVYKLQTDFFEDLGGDEMTPNWLVRKRVAAKRRRALSAKVIVNHHAVTYAEAACGKMRVQGLKFPVQAACLAVERETARKTDDVLAAHDAAEGAHAARLIVRIEEELSARAYNVEVSARRVAACDQDVADTFRLARHEGSRSAARQLPALRDAAAEARVALREARARLATSKRDIAVAEKRQANVLLELPPEVRFRAIAAGEARAAAHIALELRVAWIRARGGEQHVRRLAGCAPSRTDGARGNALSRLTEDEYDELCELDARVDETRERSKLAHDALARVVAELDAALAKAEADERARYARPSATLQPTDEERAEDAREDELCAVEEAQLLRQFVAVTFLPVLHREQKAFAKDVADAAARNTLAAVKGKKPQLEAALDETDAPSVDKQLQVPRERPRPVVVLLSRDVPGIARARLVEELDSELPGLFVRVVAPAPCGVDAAAFQAPLSLNKSVIADVDAGLCHDSRVAFLDSLVLVKAALIPTPHIVVVVGDTRNRRGPAPPAPREHYGVSEADLNLMMDGPLKRQYEEASENLAMMMRPRALDALADWSRLEYPPTKGHALALEAAILLLQRSTRLRGPDRTVTAVTWIAARRLLAQPLELVARFRDFDPATLPPATLVLLQSYCGAPDWPNTRIIGRNHTDDENDSSTVATYGSIDDWKDVLALAPLVRWIASIVAAGEYLSANGGAAPPLSRREPPELVSRVITVSDGRDALDEESEATPRGWRAALACLAEAVLEDCRGHRCAVRLAATSILTPDSTAPKDKIYNVTVYHDCGRIFFTAYDPSNSITLFTSIDERDVDSLLAPNSIEHAAHATKAPPDTIADMYSRLAALLVIERAASGHAVAPSAGVAARKLVGKPDVIAQGPQTPPRLSCRRRLHRLLRETRRVSGYLTTVTVYEEARGELRIHAYVPDHAASLDLVVSALMLNKVYTNASRHEREALESRDAYDILPFVTDRLEVVPNKAQAEDMGGIRVMCRQVRSRTREKTDRRAGFWLRVRTAQGTGRRLCRQPIRVSGVLLVMTAYECTADRLLRVRLYNPVSAETGVRLGIQTQKSTPQSARGPSRKKKNSRRETSGIVAQHDVVVGAAQLAALWKVPVGTSVLEVIAVDRGFAIAMLVGALTRHPETDVISFHGAGGNVPLEPPTLQPFSSAVFAAARPRPPENEHDGSAAACSQSRRQAPVRCYTHQPPADKLAYRIDWVVGRRSGDAVAAANTPAPVVEASAQHSPDADESPMLEEAPTSLTEATPPGDASADVRLIYQQGVRASVKPLDAAQHAALYGSTVREDGFALEVVFVKVYESYSAGAPMRELRFNVYRATTSASQSITISGDRQLREVLGPRAQHLLDPEWCEEMLRYLVVERLVLYEGVWDSDADQYISRCNLFTPRFKSHRMYDAAAKVTPLGAGGDADAAANAELLFSEKDGAQARGRKILRQAQEIEGVLMHVTAFEMPTAPSELPPIRYIAYNPRAQHTCKFVVAAETVAEVLDAIDAELPGALNKPTTRLRDPEHRFDLARTVAARFRLRCFHRAPPEVYMPWSRAERPTVVTGAPPEPEALEERRPGAPDGTREQRRHRELRTERFTRPSEDRVLGRANRLLRRLTRISGHEVIVSIFAPPEPEHALDINVYLTKHRRSVEIRVGADEQRDSLGRAVLEHSEGEPRACGFDFLLRHLRLRGVPRPTAEGSEDPTFGAERDEDLDECQTFDDSQDENATQTHISLTLETDPDKPWLAAYQSLDTSVPVQQYRPEGMPVRFVPADTRGDLVVRKGISVANGGEVVVTVSSRARGEPPSHGLVIEAYDPVTSFTAALHIVAQELLKLVDFDQNRLGPDCILATVDGLLARLC